MEYEVVSATPRRKPKKLGQRLYKKTVRKDVMDCSRWKKQVKDD